MQVSKNVLNKINHHGFDTDAFPITILYKNIFSNSSVLAQARN